VSAADVLSSDRAVQKFKGALCQQVPRSSCSGCPGPGACIPQEGVFLSVSLLYHRKQQNAIWDIVQNARKQIVQNVDFGRYQQRVVDTAEGT